MSTNIEIEISGREAWLILEYGYPFEEQKALLKPIAKKKGFYTVEIDEYWLNLIMADLSRSAREITDESLLCELEALFVSLEVNV